MKKASYIPTAFADVKPRARYLRGQAFHHSARLVFAALAAQKEQAAEKKRQALQPQADSRGVPTARPPPRIRTADGVDVCPKCGSYAGDDLEQHKASCVLPRNFFPYLSHARRQDASLLHCRTTKLAASSRRCQGRARRAHDALPDGSTAINGVSDESLAQAMRESRRVDADIDDIENIAPSSQQKLKFSHKGISKLVSREAVNAAIAASSPQMANIVIGEIIDPEDPVRKHTPKVPIRAQCCRLLPPQSVYALIITIRRLSFFVPQDTPVYGAFCGEDMPAWTVLGEYSGEVRESPPQRPTLCGRRSTSDPPTIHRRFGADQVPIRRD